MSHRVVVTGAAGVIGRELLSRLIASGADILSLDRDPLPALLADQVRHIQVDLAIGGMEEIKVFAPDEIYHLAAAFERSTEEPGFWTPNFHDNVQVTHRLHTVIRELGSVKTYLFASSYLIYDPVLYMFGSPQEAARKLRGDSTILPRNLCGVAKYAGEREIEFLTEVDLLPLRAVSARIYRVYGRGSRCVISRWTRSLLKGQSITIFNPLNRFDYVFAGDVAEGLIRLARAPHARGIVNLATGRSRTVSEVSNILRGLIEGAGALMEEGDDIPPYEASESDVARLEQLTGWRPPTGIEEGIGLIVDYERALMRKS
jgi:carbamoyl-phosphate synthase large subunit